MFTLTQALHCFGALFMLSAVLCYTLPTPNDAPFAKKLLGMAYLIAFVYYLGYWLVHFGIMTV